MAAGPKARTMYMQGWRVSQYDHSSYSHSIKKMCCILPCSHPGPRNPDGSFKGRASPEIDILEAYSYEKSGTGYASQSLQVAPYDADRRVKSLTLSQLDLIFRK